MTTLMFSEQPKFFNNQLLSKNSCDSSEILHEEEGYTSLDEASLQTDNSVSHKSSDHIESERKKETSFSREHSAFSNNTIKEKLKLSNLGIHNLLNASTYSNKRLKNCCQRRYSLNDVWYFWDNLSSLHSKRTEQSIFNKSRTIINQYDSEKSLSSSFQNYENYKAMKWGEDALCDAVDVHMIDWSLTFPLNSLTKTLAHCVRSYCNICSLRNFRFSNQRQYLPAALYRKMVLSTDYQQLFLSNFNRGNDEPVLQSLSLNRLKQKHNGYHTDSEHRTSHKNMLPSDSNALNMDYAESCIGEIAVPFKVQQVLDLLMSWYHSSAVVLYTRTKCPKRDAHCLHRVSSKCPHRNIKKV